MDIKPFTGIRFRLIAAVFMRPEFSVQRSSAGHRPGLQTADLPGGSDTPRAGDLRERAAGRGRARPARAAAVGGALGEA